MLVLLVLKVQPVLKVLREILVMMVLVVQQDHKVLKEILVLVVKHLK